MNTAIRGTTTVEVMIALVAMSLVLTASHAAKAALFHSYRDVVHRERAQLYASETFEQLEALRLSRLQQNYRHSWERFLGDRDEGYYQLVPGVDVNQWQLVSIGMHVPSLVDESYSVRLYADEADALGRVDSGFFTRLERRLLLEPIPVPDGGEQVRVTVSIYWGLPGDYRAGHPQQILLQALYADQIGPSFVL